MTDSFDPPNRRVSRLRQAPRRIGFLAVHGRPFNRSFLRQWKTGGCLQIRRDRVSVDRAITGSRVLLNFKIDAFFETFGKHARGRAVYEPVTIFCWSQRAGSWTTSGEHSRKSIWFDDGVVLRARNPSFIGS